MLEVRVKANGINPAGEVTTLEFTEDQVTPKAPGVRANDITNKIEDAKETMEYSIDGGFKWQDYYEYLKPTFPGKNTVKVRVKASGINPAGEVTTLYFTEDPVTLVTPGAITPAAPSVKANDKANIIDDADETMEYSTDGGNSWEDYNEIIKPMFLGKNTVKVRVKTNGINLAGEVTTLDFTEDPVTPGAITPAAPSVKANDKANIIIDADETMEYSTDSGNSCKDYSEIIKPTFLGKNTVKVRVKANGINPAGEVTILDFTEDPITTDAPDVKANDNTNKIENADATMEYSTDDGFIWNSFNPTDEPVFVGEQTVQVRVKASGINPAGKETVLKFTTNQIASDQPQTPATETPSQPSQPSQQTPSQQTPSQQTPSQQTPATSTPSVAPTTIPAKSWKDVKSNIGKLHENKDSDEPVNVVIKMDNLNTSVLPKNVIEDIKGKNIDLKIDMGDGVQWKINGEAVTGDNLKDIDLKVEKDTNVIPESIIEETVNNNTYVEISLAHEGSFGFDAELTIHMEEEKQGQYANLYFCNKENNKLEFVGSSLIDENQNAQLKFTHASDYTVIISDELLLDEELIKEATINTTKETLTVGGTKNKSKILKITLPEAIQNIVDSGLAKCRITYKSSNKNILAVSAKGKITAKKTGKATITTTVNIDGKEVKFKSIITVKKAKKK